MLYRFSGQKSLLVSLKRCIFASPKFRTRMKTLSNCFTFLCIPAVMISLSSCIKDEAPNAECDIEEVTVVVDEPESFFFNVTDMTKSIPSADSVIVFSVRRKADISSVAPAFRLSEGATINPESGSVQDFSNGPVTYTVTSQDGNWRRRYRISFKQETKMVGDTVRYDFEKYSTVYFDASKATYNVWLNDGSEESLGTIWATGNPGYAITASNATPDLFPSSVLEQGYDGAAVKLTTCSTGFIGQLFGKPIAAGNLFIGSFDTTTAMMDPLRATTFGIPFDRKPLRMTGYYKYTPGDKVTDAENKELAGQVDSADVYAVFFRNHDSEGNAWILDGTNVKTGSQIVAIADMVYVAPASDWTAFSIDFDYKGQVDLDLLANRGYSMTVVFSSSKGGDSFIGAVGSTLCIDKVRLICESEDN